MKSDGVPPAPLSRRAGQILADPDLVVPGRQLALEAGHVQPDRPRRAAPGRRPPAAVCRWYSRSCISQNFPCSPAASAALAAGERVGMGRAQGKMPEHEPQVPAERLPGRLDHGCSAPQWGHSKSPYSTRVTRASAGPSAWSRSVTGGVSRLIG